MRSVGKFWHDPIDELIKWSIELKGTISSTVTSFSFNEDVDLLNDVLTTSYFYKPFPIEEKDMLFRTRSSFEYFKANRRWKPPAIQI